MLVDEERDDNDGRASWKGKSIEQLVAAHCVLASGGRLNVSLPVVDDDGIDLVFHLGGRPAILAVQVKSRFASAEPILTRRNYWAEIRRATFQPRDDLALLFVLFDDVDTWDLSSMWLVPSLDFARLTSNQVLTRPKLIFAVSLSGSNNQWIRYRCDRRSLPGRLLETLEHVSGMTSE